MNNYSFSDLKIGQKERFNVLITEEMLTSFRCLTGDFNPLHNDIKYAKEQGFSNIVCYGMLTAAFLSTLAGVYIPGKRSLIHSVEVGFISPVIVGDFLEVVGEIIEMNDSFHMITLKTTIINQNGVRVLKGKMKVRLMSNEG